MPQGYKRLINKEKERKDVIQIIDDEGFLREVSFDDLVSHPTTLAGYGITDAYISNGTIYLGNQSITPASVSSLGTAAYKDYTASVIQGSTDLPTSDAVFQAIGAAVSSALHYRGISSTIITDGGTETAVIDGQPLVVQSGDVVIYSGFEFLWENNVWNKLGDDTSFALKTVQITGDGIYITGGGDLTTSRSLGLSQAAIDALALASTALQSVAFSDLTSHPTTLSGYGITDANISNGTITLGNNTITPLTSFTESDPTVPSWAKAVSKPSYSFSEITNKPTTIAGYGITDAKINNNTITIGSNSITTSQVSRYSLAPQSAVDIKFSDSYHAIVSARFNQNMPDLVLIGNGYGSTYARNHFTQVNTLSGSIHWRYYSGVGVQIINTGSAAADIVVVCNTVATVTFSAAEYDTTSAYYDAPLALASALSNYVPTSRKVNNKTLDADITLSLDDVADGSTRKLSNAIPYSEILSTANSFDNRHLWLHEVSNTFWAANLRYDVTLTGFSSGVAAYLFDGSFETVIRVAPGETGVITIAGKDGSRMWGGGFPYGYLEIAFYYSAIPESVSVRVYSNYSSYTGWHNISMTNVDRAGDQALYRGYNSWYGVTTIEITVVAKESYSSSYNYAGVTQVSFFQDRGTLPEMAVFNKSIAQTLYYNLTAPKYIVTGGTSSQFLKADGSLDSNTYRKKSDNNFTSIETGEIHCTGDIEANGNLTINDVIASAINAQEEISIPTQMPSTIELGRVFMYYDEAVHQLCIRESDGTIKTIQFT